MRGLIKIVVAASVLVLSFDTSPAFARLYLEPRIGSTMAVRLDDGDLTEQRNIFGLKVEYDSSNFRMMFEGEYRYNSIYDFNDEYSEAAKNKYQSVWKLEKGCLGYLWQGWNLSLGYQKVAWGEADDLRVVDVVNPLYLEDFVLLDLDEYRIPQNMLRAEGALTANWELELLWIFQFEPNDFPPPGSEFTSPLIPSAGDEKPDGSEFGIRASSMINDTDLSLYGFYGFQDTPIYLLENGSLEGHYKPQPLIGLSFNQPAGVFVIRGETAFLPDKSFGTDNGTESKHHEVQALLGTDYLYLDWIVSAQIADRYIHEWSSELVDSQWDTFITAAIEGTSFAATLTTRLAVTWAFASGGGSLSQLKLAYQPDKHWTLRFSIDILNGDRENFFGQFSDKDRFLISVTYAL